MELKLGNFHVRDVVFGEKTFFKDGVLTINKQEAIDVVKRDERIISCDIRIAHPGDSVRMYPVKSVVEPRCKIGEERASFPGYYGTPITEVGEGTTHCLKDMSVLTIGKYGHIISGLLDMKGPGAKTSHYSRLINVCLLLETTDEEYEKKYNPVNMEDASHVQASLALAEYLGETVRELTPDEYEEYRFDPILKQSPELKDLPKVVFVMGTHSNGEHDYMNQQYYGWSTRLMLPFLVSPTKLLDGALAAEHWNTPVAGGWGIDVINAPVVKRLCREHGKTINFIGVILSNNNTELTAKERNVQIVAETCKMLGVDGAIVFCSSYGNPFVDYIKTIAALEKQGIKTSGIALECSGRDGRGQPFTVIDPAADKLVTVGNVSEVVELPPMDEVWGDIQALMRDPSVGAWTDNEEYGPSLRPDGSIVIENNNIMGATSVWGCNTKTLKEF